MRRRLLLFVLLASALAFLASLYLTWVASSGPAESNSATGLLDLFSRFSQDGWGLLGQAAALVALALGAGAGLSLLRPQFERRLPLASCAFTLLFFALANAGELHGTGLFQAALGHFGVHLAAGAYLGLASAAVAFLAAVGTRWDELARRPSATAVVAGVLTLGLLAAFLLPWLHVHAPRHQAGVASGYQLAVLGDNAVIFIAAVACSGLPLWTRGTSTGRRLVTALGLAVLTGGYVSPLGLHHHWPYETSLAVACSLGLVALALATGRGLRISLPRAADATAVVAACLLLASLFLPWQKDCPHGACLSANGWSAGAYGPTAGGLAVLLVLFLLGSRRFVVELAVGAAIYVMATGFEVTRYFSLGYGAPLGFVGAALLLLTASWQLRSVTVDLKRLLSRLVPMVACLAFLAIPVATLTGRLSPQLELDSPWRVFWLEVAAILVALRLLGRWLSGPRDDPELMLLPCALLSLTALDLIVARRQGVSWEGWASVGLCLFLAVLGWIERTGGLEKLRVPEEIWRVDRLPGEG
jgi:hypothetical protein